MTVHRKRDLTDHSAPVARAEHESRRVAVEVLEPVARISQTDAVGDLTVNEACAVISDGENE